MKVSTKDKIINAAVQLFNQKVIPARPSVKSQSQLM